MVFMPWLHLTGGIEPLRAYASGHQIFKYKSWAPALYLGKKMWASGCRTAVQ